MADTNTGAPTAGEASERKSGNRLSRLFKSIRGRPNRSSQPKVAANGQQKVAANGQQTSSVAQPSSTQTPPPAVVPVAATGDSQKPLVLADNPTTTVRAAAGEALTIKLRNHTTTSNTFAYITGTDLDNGRLCLLQADGRTLYYPASPSATGQPLAVDCAIQLAAPRQTRTVTLPHYLAGARLWFAVNGRITFLVNPGPGLVEPSVNNSADPNHDVYWDFCEFTYNSANLFANISHVDFFSVPVALTLYPTNNGAAQHVSGTNQNGLQDCANALRQQQNADGQPWGNLIVNNAQGQLLRVLSPNSAISQNNSLFGSYYDGYVQSVWNQYTSQELIINTQAGYGNVAGRVVGNSLNFNNLFFPRPSSHDIFSCSTGPFAVTQPTTAQAPIIPRLAAAFNRSTLLQSNQQPNGVQPSNYYSTSPTNHYARIIHQHSLDGRGYAFPYDDVTPNGGVDQAGIVQGQARLFIVAVGGNGAGTGPAPEDDGVAASSA